MNDALDFDLELDRLDDESEALISLLVDRELFVEDCVANSIRKPEIRKIELANGLLVAPSLIVDLARDVPEFPQVIARGSKGWRVRALDVPLVEGIVSVPTLHKLARKAQKPIREFLPEHVFDQARRDLLTYFRRWVAERDEHKRARLREEFEAVRSLAMRGSH